MKKKTLKITPMGGVGEIGRNMTVYQYAGEYLIVDAGLMFPDSDMPGVDYIIPDISSLLKKRDKIRGIVITHGHEDHIGAIRHIIEDINAPIYATPLTRGLIEVKLARGGLLKKAQLNTVQAGDSVKIGPFQVEFFHVSHSIPDAVGMGITTPAGLVVHTGDYKFDHTPVDNWPTDFTQLSEFSRRGVLALLGDSTNAETPGWTPSEQVVNQGFEQVFSQAKGRILIASFASLISRMQQVVNIAQKYNRKIAFVGTSMIDNAKMARKLGYLEVPEEMVVFLDQALNLPKDKVVLMITGSQGEPNSILGRLSTGRHRQLSIETGDTVVLSSQAIPGNEELVYRTINRLFEYGADVIYENIAPVHVSGHASQEELKLMINLVKPKYLVPVHGELRHLKRHAYLAQQVGIPAENILISSNGQTIEFTNGEASFGEKIPYQAVFVSGSSVGDLSQADVRERDTLAKEGMVVVNLVVDKLHHRVLRKPTYITQGFPAEVDEVLDKASDRIFKVASKANGNLNEKVVEELRSHLRSQTGNTPSVFVNVTEI
ncbi:ribonuclease J [Ornatilinea apprima]|uniref:Ribonuclease J n=1 Tax=Ornatilinea apprima TaxID=1134406 RepID=A0A0P6XJ46_9CHLR|nr:ribonuclease J [Ornatilinea apprima]KPL71224.1 ribonuclease J [Ornatilinea apprima]